MKTVIASLSFTLICLPAFAGTVRAVPEFDGALSVLMIALVGGLALVLKKKKD